MPEQMDSSEALAGQMFMRLFRADAQVPPWRRDRQRELVQPGSGYLGVREVLGVVLECTSHRLIDLGSLPGGWDGQRLLALRYFIENADIWLDHFAWQHRIPPDAGPDAEARVRDLAARIAELRGSAPAPDGAFLDALARADGPLADLAAPPALEALAVLSAHPAARASLRERVRERASELFATSPALLDRLYLAATELDRYPAHSVSAGTLEYVIIADKGEMGVRAVRETIALGKVPVVLYSARDDASALQVRLAQRHARGFAIGLEGSFRESYANYAQIAARVHEELRRRFGAAWERELARAALYPGYGPLAENAAAIRHLRRNGIVFVGPMQDVVERAGDKRRFRAVVESIAPEAVTPGLVIERGDAAQIRARVLDAQARGALRFPGRLKAANGGGGRGQAIVGSLDRLDAAITKVLGEIESNGWEPGVMFEQNIPETIHLEVQVLRDRYGTARHFGMRDCTEQRASQKIQEEAPPALLRRAPELQRWIERTAVQVAEQVGYVGAGTVELMYAAGKVYFLEMNTRIQVEHPVTEESHGIRRPSGEIEPLDLVQWQLRLADGAPIDFAQDDVVRTHVAREYRINAERWRPDLKDPRDGERGLFVPNAGVFDRIETPDPERLRERLGLPGLEDLKIRFDVGFEPGDVLVNKDPTFGKLIVAVRATEPERAFELLRLASLAVLEEVRIEGRQVRPDGKVVAGQPLETNLAEHRWILAHEVLRAHAAGEPPEQRHVGWVVDALRARDRGR